MRLWFLFSILVVILSLNGCASEDQSHDWNTRVLKLRGFSNNSQGFFAAANEDDLIALEAFINLGMSPNVQNEFGRTTLMEAARKGDLEVVNFLLKAGADVNIKDRGNLSALFHAIDAHQDQMVSRIIDSPQLDINARGKNGVTALISFVWRDDEPMVNKLLTLGADVNLADNDGDTALHGAARSGGLTILRSLLEHGANANARNKVGGTPLMWAAVYGKDDAATFLMEHGANVADKDNEGLTALDWAVRNKNDSIVAILRR